jgi:hypothetical protein
MAGESKDGEKSNASKYTAEAMLKLLLDMKEPKKPKLKK